MFPAKASSIFAGLIFVSLVLAQSEPGLKVRPGSDPAKITVEAALPGNFAQTLPAGKLDSEQGEKLLQLFVRNQGKAGPPMLGSYEKKGSLLVFQPRFTLEPGQLYGVKLTLPGQKVVTAEYRVPPLEKMPPAVVEKIYPTSDVLPANHLKWYIYFSEPMRGGKDIFDLIQIIDDKGNPISDAWLLDELWSLDGKMLIIYIQPGRIKWGVGLRELLGPVLYPNRSYTLKISGEMLDARGQKLGKDYTKKFKTTAEDRVFIDLGDWKIQSPKANTKEPVTVQFPKLIDHKSLHRFLTILDAKGKEVPGKITIGQLEKSWSFHPDQPWQAARYTLEVDGDLEDNCGNTPLRPFDLDLKVGPPPKQVLSRSFQPVETP